MRCVLVALMCKAHSKSGYCSFMVAKRGEGAKGQSCHLTFLHILMVPKGNSSSAVLPVLQSSVGVKKWDRMCASVCARVCLCTLMSCLFFAGDSPCSLATAQDLFSPSLYITAKSIIEAVCPVLSFPPPPPPPLHSPLPLPFPILHLPVCVGAFKTWLRSARWCYYCTPIGS